LILDIVHALTIKSTKAAARLADLETKRSRSTDASRLVEVATRQLAGTLSDLNVAIEHLEETNVALAKTRAELQTAHAQQQEFVDLLPVPTVFTGPGGTILRANPAAAALLNMSTRHLPGKSLVLFVGDRDQFLAVAGTLHEQAGPVTLHALVRPRDRKLRLMTIDGRHLPAHGEHVWFLQALRDPQTLQE
jgi:PAS domain-containing protein